MNLKETARDIWDDLDGREKHLIYYNLNNKKAQVTRQTDRWTDKEVSHIKAETGG